MVPKRISFFLIVFGALAIFSASALEVTDGLNRSVSLSKPAARVVSLSPACTEILFAIGAGDQIVGVTDYCDYPEAARAKPKVGGFSGKSLSLETIVALRPDLVVTEGGMHVKVIEALEQAGLRCYAAEAFRLSDAYRLIRQLGFLTGTAEAAEKVAGTMESRIAAVAAKSAGLPRPTAFWVVWDDPLMTVGGPTFISDAISAAGARSIFIDSKEQYPAVSFETVLARNPDWILSGTDHGERMNVRVLSTRQGWRSLEAVKRGRIALIDADSINRAGPRLADAVEELARAFRPELFSGIGR